MFPSPLHVNRDPGVAAFVPLASWKWKMAERERLHALTFGSDDDGTMGAIESAGIAFLAELDCAGDWERLRSIGSMLVGGGTR
jgi:hypothetical protein